MNPVELEFILTGLQEFVSGIGEANDALKGLKDSAPTSVFETLWDKATTAIGNFAERVWDVASVTIGILLRDAIRGAIDLFTEWSGAIYDTANELNMIEFRLRGVNYQAQIESGKDYTAAMEGAIGITKDAMDWMMRLSAITPFGVEDIGSIYTAGRMMQLTDEQARKLTESISDYTSAMGLGEYQGQLLIENLRQMATRGKITATEIRDLARGAYLPVMDVQQRIAEKMGMTLAALQKQIQTPEGIPAHYFIEAFEEMIDEEAMFEDASRRMSHTWSGATKNVEETLRGFLAKFILLPGILDPLGDRIGDFMDTLAEPENWDRLIGSFETVGITLGEITNQIIDAFFPRTRDQSIVEKIISGLKSISDWLKIHEKDIVEFFLGTETWQPFGKTGREGGLFKDIGKIIQDVTKFVGKLVEAFNTISDWVNANKPLIDEFFSALGDILSEIFTNLTGGVFSKGAGGEAGLAGFLNIVSDVMKWIIDNKDKIADFATVILKVWIAFEAGKLVLNTILNFLGLLLQGLLTLLSPMFYVAVVFGLMIFSIWNSISTQKDKVFGFFDDLRTKLNETVTAIQSIDWFQLGKNIILAIADGIGSVAHIIISAMEQIGYNAARGLLQSLGLGALGSLIPSPGGGEETPQTGGGGKEGYKLTALPTVNNATALVSIPTSPSSSISSSAVVNNYMNLVVNSAAPVESVVQDYAMMQALVG